MYAGFWIRVITSLIDIGPFWIIRIILARVLHSAGIIDLSWFDSNYYGINLWSLFLGWLYYAIFESTTWQGTPGKKILGIKVTDINGRKISFIRASLRHLSKVIPMGFLWVAFNPLKRGLHDIIAGTLVVKTETRDKYRDFVINENGS